MAGRPRSIDRDKVLDAAEAIVARTGAAGLSFETVAREAGITKSGAQYCFGTKENLIQSMIERWGASFEKEVAARSDGDVSQRGMIRSYIEATRDSDEAEYSRSAVMMTALIQSPEQVGTMREWYRRRLAMLDQTGPEATKLALAFFAGEGAFMLRAFGLLEISDEKWNAVFDSIIALAGTGE